MPSYNLSVNDKKYTVNADAQMPLLWVIRELVGLTGTKYGCGIAQCGACTCASQRCSYTLLFLSRFRRDESTDHDH
jgi:aerobic-type carbon monoxide dehydrogenase small subunit (CoxS/CutS family)